MPTLPSWPYIPFALWALSVLLALLLSFSVSATQAWAAPSVSLAPGFAAGSGLGEVTTLGADLTLSGSEYHGHVAPLTSLTLHLPSGTSLTGTGFPTCSLEAIKAGEQCPVGSLAGPLGSFTAWVAFGGSMALEQGEVQALWGPGGDLYFMATGHSPVSLEYVMEGHVEPASPPNGPSLTLNVPVVETVPGAPAMSLTALDLNLGSTRLEAGGSEVGSLTAPATCTTGLDWAVDAGFNGEASQPVAEANQGCLPSAQRAKATTSLSATKTVDESEETVILTATVQPIGGGVVPSGTVTFYDGVRPVLGCASQPVTGGTGTATASCATSYVSNIGPPSHHLTALYSGDENYRGSFSQALTVTVGEGEKSTEPPAKETETTNPPSGGGGTPPITGSNGTTPPPTGSTPIPPVRLAPKPLTTMQKLVKALKACKKLKHRKRKQCEAQAKRRYKAKKINRGINRSERPRRPNHHASRFVLAPHAGCLTGSICAAGSDGLWLLLAAG